MQKAPSVTGRHLGEGLHLFSGAHSMQDTPSPSSVHCAQDSDETPIRLHGPQALSSSSPIPNISSTTDLRSPPVAIVSTPSPTDTTSFATATISTTSSSASSTTHPISFPHSPWHALAATGGAMTPSLDGPSLAPRGSPQLGRPFEKLSLGGTWSASNLREETSESPLRAPRAGIPRGAVSGGDTAPHKSLRAPIALSSLAQRRALGASMSLGPLRSGGGGGQPVTPSPLTGASSASTSASTSASNSASTSRLKPLAPSALPSLVAADSTLILDIRPPSSFHESHIPNAHSIPVPSTLLRRPNFGISKLCAMLPTSSREAVGRWRDKADIVMIDQDSTVVLEGCVLLGLTGKFEREGFGGKLWFVSGGHAAVEDQDCVQCVCDGPADANPTPPPSSNASLGIGRLPRLAFQHMSTGSARGFTTAATHRADPFQSLHLGSSAPVSAGRLPRSGESSRIRLQPANPFFDNIRQNLELSHGGITERIPLSLPARLKRRVAELPKFLSKLVNMSDNESQDFLADQFYRIELGEQKRLQSIMDILSKGTCAPASALSAGLDDKARSPDDIEQLMTYGADKGTYYPMSITAGLERGAKNRYKNIWPFDYSRVRLGTPTEDNSDYINASFVQPRGTTRRYIATQGPLDATYCDFWTLVWEQNVRVIVMLTKQFEGGQLKCGNYWQEHEYGELHLRLVSQVGGDDHAAPAVQSGFDFGNTSAMPSNPGGNIHRTFHLWHNRFPNQPPRIITQIQCVDWPDFDVPESPEILLGLMKDVDKAVSTTGLSGCGEDRCTFPPVLVHCSAGVGRTGSYILVDAISDALRREIRGSQDVTASPWLPPTAKVAVPFTESPMPLGENMDVDPATRPPLDKSDSSGSTSSPESEKPRPITQSHRRHRSATPLSSMKEPILEVLQSMRVQRMSLVQSLRQYLFVHRAIIAQYFEMVDEESRRRSSASDTQSVLSRGSGATATTAGTTSMSSLSTEDEAHIKRKPSSADLQPEVDLRLQSVADLRLSEGSGGAVNLAKRASFKKRRGPNASSVPGTPHRPSPTGSVSLVSPPLATSPTVPSTTQQAAPSSRRARLSRSDS